MIGNLSNEEHAVACKLSNIKQKIDKLLSELLDASNAFATCYNNPNSSLDKSTAFLAHDILGRQVTPRVETLSSAMVYHNNKSAHLNASITQVTNSLKVNDEQLITAHLRYRSLVNYLSTFKVLSDLNVHLRAISNRFTDLESEMQVTIGAHPMRHLTNLHKTREDFEASEDEFADTYDKAAFMHVSLSDLITSLESLVEHLRELSLSVRKNDVKQKLGQLASTFEHERTLFLNENTAIFHMVKKGEHAAVDVGEAKLAAAVTATVRVSVNGLLNIRTGLTSMIDVAMDTGTHSAEQQCLTTLMTVKFVVSTMLDKHGLLETKQKEKMLELMSVLDKAIVDGGLKIDKSVMKY